MRMRADFDRPFDAGGSKMSESMSNERQAVPSGTDLWREHADELADPWSSSCFGCGSCLDHCPAVRHGSGFDPRDIMLKVRYGLADRLLTPHSVLWQCFGCNACCESCAQPLKPAVVIGRLRKMIPPLVFPERRESL